MVDLFRSRRGYNHRCLYWKRNENGIMDNEQLIHNVIPNGIFYAKNISSKANDTNDIAGVFRVATQGTMIETEDCISLDKDDLVLYDEEIWIVGKVNSNPVEKNAEFGRNISYKTTIELNKGK